MIGQIVLTIKDKFSIVSLVGVVEIVRTSRQIMQITLIRLLHLNSINIFCNCLLPINLFFATVREEVAEMKPSYGSSRLGIYEPNVFTLFII